MAGDDFAGLTIDELDDCAQRVVTCLDDNPADAACLVDAYRCARGCLDLIDYVHFLVERLTLISAQLELVRKGKPS